MRRVPRYLVIGFLVAMVGFTAAGFLTIRRDVGNLRVLRQENALWNASQLETELLRFRLSLEAFQRRQTQAAADDVRERFDILWSRTFTMSHGRIGETLRRYDAGHGAIAAVAAYLQEIDPVVASLGADSSAGADSVADRLVDMQDGLREYTKRVVDGEGAVSERLWSRMEGSAGTTAAITLAAVLLSALSLLLILREINRQALLAEMGRKSTFEAEQASRAKSRFLTMMSHELRNPLNGVLGPLALLGQSELGSRQKRLVEQATQSGQTILQMLSGLLDYGEMQDGRFQMRHEPFRVAALADAVRDALVGEGAGGIAVRVRSQTPRQLYGDPARLRQIFVHLAEFVLEVRDSEGVSIEFGHDGANLVGEIAFAADGTLMDWKLDLLMGLSEVQADQVSTEALRPLIARGLISAGRGMLTLVDDEATRRAIRVTVPAEPVRFEKIRLHLETRSAALATLYQAALRSDRVVFAPAGSSGPVDVVLVDITSVAEDPQMSGLRARFPNALFVSLGPPQAPDVFDDIVETPSDMSRLRTSIFGRLAS